MRGGIPVTERFDERGDVTAVVGRQLVDAGDQELPLPVVLALLSRRRPVVVVQPGRLGRGDTDHRDGRAEPFGERVNGGRARRPDQVPRGGERVDSGPGQPRAAGDRAVGPAPVLQPLMDQPLQRVHFVWRCQGRILRGAWLVVCGVRRHAYQPNPAEGRRGSS